MERVTWVGPSRLVTVEEWAALTGSSLAIPSWKIHGTDTSGSPTAGTTTAGIATGGTTTDGTDPAGTATGGTNEDGTTEDGSPTGGSPAAGTTEDGIATGGTTTDGTDPAGTATGGTNEDGSPAAGTATGGTDPGGINGAGSVVAGGVGPVGDGRAVTGLAGFPAVVPAVVPVVGDAAMASRLAVVRAAVPDLPKAPRPGNPAPMPWSPAGTADALDGLDPAGLADNELLDFIHAANRLAAFARAVENQGLAAFATRRPPLAGENVKGRKNPEESMWAAGEIMALYCVGKGTAQHRLDDAQTLIRHLPATTAQYRQGLLDEVRIRAIHRGIENIPVDILPALEPLFLPGASRMNPAALTRKIRRLAEKHHPEPLGIRHERARRDRTVWLTPLPDGMALLGAILPAVTAAPLFESLQAWATAAARDGEPSTALTPTGRPSRSYTNYLADCYTDLIHQAFLHPTGSCENCTCNHENYNHTNGTNTSNQDNGHNTGGQDTGQDTAGPDNDRAGGRGSPPPVPEPRFKPRIPAKINLTIPFLTAMNHSEEPGHLNGYGPIPAEQARELAGEATSWIRILTDPEKETILSVGRHAYAPPADMARLVRLKSPTCTGIGCERSADHCQLDHTIPFHQNRYTPDGTLLPHGETSTENLRPRSLYCHRLKDDPTTGWTVEPQHPGTTKTTTPTGRTYLDTQDEPAPF
ncbi:DUF222 domain-containing protein [Arthrobacter livingstonensis]|nr:DUF222 domain-containing protein [Arthrobacter livingstonensis]